MAQNKFRIPSTQGGIVRYSDEDTGSKFAIKPEYVIGAIIAAGVIIVALQVFGIF